MATRSDDIQQRALALLEREEQEVLRQMEQEEQAERESRFADARRRIKEQDREIAAEQARKEAQAEALVLSQERYGLGKDLEEAAANLNRLLGEYEDLHRRHADALRRAGRPLGHDYRLPDVITAWWKDRFGGPNSLTGTPAGHMDAIGHYEERRRKGLPERDPLADAPEQDAEMGQGWSKWGIDG